MEKFYKESGILVCEWSRFENAILQGTHGFSFSAEQWKNRRIGRTKVSDSEKIAMIRILEELRKESHDNTL